jgi:hypothetical protein
MIFPVAPSASVAERKGNTSLNLWRVSATHSAYTAQSGGMFRTNGTVAFAWNAAQSAMKVIAGKKY